MSENKTWDLILKEEQIEIKKYPRSENPIACAISSFSIFKISGNDRCSFLQNQLTNNLTEEKICQLSAWCNPKGKVIANFIIMNTGKYYLLFFRNNLKDYLYKKLNLYILRSDVIIEDVTSLYLQLGLSNIDKLNLYYPTKSLKEGEIEFIDKNYIARLPDHSGRYLMVAEVESIKDVIRKLKDSINFAGYLNWEKQDILLKIPWIDFENKEKYLPQMINLDKLNAISFKKGCYSGQEVIAKVHYRGKIKRNMMLISSKNELHPGCYLYSESTEKKVGDILNSSSEKFDNNFFGLAIIESEKLNDNLFVDTNTRHKINIVE